MIILNSEVVEFGVYPNGETKVNTEQLQRIMNQKMLNIINFKYENDSDLIKLMFLRCYLDEHSDAEVYLNIHYMPYSRMDRVENKSAFTLKYVSTLINSLWFNGVTIIEPHSDVTPALIERSHSLYPTVFMLDRVLEEIDFNKEIDYLFFPDAGASKRYGNLRGFKTLVGHKHRNFETGKIESLMVVGESALEPISKVLILDDLCSYGGTFMLSAESLKRIGASEIYLFVTHCEDSIHKGKVLETDLIQKVFTTDSILTQPHEKIHVFTIE